jgi:aryl-alcohol dehydrogenase-like predicted oxidoreductase
MNARLGLGLAALGRPGYLNIGHGADLGDDRSVGALRARAHEVLDAAYEAGVRYFDAARSYGRAEEFLGGWLRSRVPEDVVVSSKWGYVYTANWEVAHDPPEVKHHDVETFRRQLEETRSFLGDWLSLYQIHSATPDSGVLSNEAVLSAMRDAGVPLGVSVSGPSQGETLDQAISLGLFSSVQATWNLYERAAEGALERAHAAGLTVYVKEGLANGRLVREPALGPSPDAVALAAILAKPWVDVVLSGAATVETLRSNLRGLEVTAGAFDELREDSAAYWAYRGTLAWN